MLKHPELTLRRITNCLAQRLEPLCIAERIPLDVAAFHVHGEPVSWEEASRARYEPFAIGAPWGPAWDTTWFRFTARVPDAWAGREVIALIDLGFGRGEGFTCEGQIWRDGRPRGAVNVNRRDVPLLRPARGGETVSFLVEAGANGHALTAVGREAARLDPDFDGPPGFTLAAADLAVFDRDVWDLWLDMQLGADALACLPADAPRHGRLLRALNAAVNRFDPDDRASLARMRSEIADVLACRNGDTVHEISAIGHAHIDTAWLWPLRETIRKCARTFGTALGYMDEYPEYVFGCSQAQQYSWMKRHYPDIYSGIQDAVKRGQWEPIGSMWIEADCNVSGGEALVRQIIHGKQFFLDEFGVDTIDLWIPDVFGYSASLPQIMKQAGIRYFLTQKISWNQFNRFPHHTFLWEGIDGSRVFTHFPPADTYNGSFRPQELRQSVQRFRENDRATRSLYPYGFGDGGGGPTRRMLENARRLRDFEGLPRVTLEKVRDFFPKAERDAVDLPLWVGELYLELHRGTYTTQARNKRGNRKGELLLRDAELFDAIDHVLAPDADGPSVTTQAPPRAVHDTHAHPRAEERRGHVGALDRAWKLLLLNQFHDILPGSSIHRVYQDSARDYDTIQTLGAQVRDDAVDRLTEGLGTGDARRPLAVLNTLAHRRQEVISTPEGDPLRVDVPPCGWAVADAEAAHAAPDGGPPPVTVERQGRSLTLDNGLLRVVLDEQGLLAEVHDQRADRAVLAPAARGNVFQLHDDYPNNWDAWDVDVFYRESMQAITGLETLTVAEATPLRATVRLVRAFGPSRIEQDLVLRAGSARLDFVTRVDWQHRHRFLKVAFPVDVHAGRATYEIQYGHTERPTHQNTSWDVARFEVCAQKWVDLSEPGYGVALLNDCKYGHDIHGHVMRLSLLRGPTQPDPDADLGEHVFTYALLPHPGDLRSAGVVEQAYALNVPLLVRPVAPAPDRPRTAHAWLQVDRPGIVVEAVKVAERGRDLVVRLYEAHGTRGPLKLRMGLPVTGAVRTDLLERTAEPLDMTDGSIELSVRPFEIMTLKFTCRAGEPEPALRQ